MDKVCEGCQVAGSSKKALSGTHLNINSKILLNQQDDHEECAKALPDLAADVNAQGFGGPTLLAQAAERGDVKSLKALITAGADVNLIYIDRNRLFPEHLNALTNAISGGNRKCVELLIKAGASVSRLEGSDAILNPAVRNYDTACVSLLVKAGASVNDHIWAPLSVAVQRNAVKCLELLLTLGADVNHMTSETHFTALMTVKSVECCRLLLLNNAHINIMNSLGHNALTHNISYNYRYIDKDVCSLLFAAGKRTPETVQKLLEPTESIIVAEYLPQIQIKFNLKHLCREAIRKYLIDLDPHTHLFGRIPRLRLPKSITEYLLYYLSLDPPSPSDNDTK